MCQYKARKVCAGKDDKDDTTPTLSLPGTEEINLNAFGYSKPDPAGYQ